MASSNGIYIYIYICFSVQLSFTARPQGKTGPISRTNLDQYQKSIWTYIKDQSGPIFPNQSRPIWTNTRIDPLMTEKLVSQTNIQSGLVSFQDHSRDWCFSISDSQGKGSASMVESAVCSLQSYLNIVLKNILKRTLKACECR